MTSAAQPYRAEQLAQACNLGTSTLFEASGLSTSRPTHCLSSPAPS